MHFYESCPYLKFAHFTANQAILEAFAGCCRVHVIDFGMKQGMQWPALMQALALRRSGPPLFRLTGIGPPQPDNIDALQQVGWRLTQLADTIHVDFQYRGYVANSLADLEPYMLEAEAGNGGADEESEAVVVNSVFELHRLLAWSGALEKVLGTVWARWRRFCADGGQQDQVMLEETLVGCHGAQVLRGGVSGLPLPAGEPPLRHLPAQALIRAFFSSSPRRFHR